MKKIIYLTITFLLIMFTFALSYVVAQNYFHGNIDNNGQIEIWDRKGNYYWGEIDRNGNIEIWDRKRNYYWGDINRNGNGFLHDTKGNHYYIDVY